MYLDNHHDDGRLAIWCASAPEQRAMLVDSGPDAYFIPPYVAPSAGSASGSTASWPGLESRGWSNRPISPEARVCLRGAAADLALDQRTLRQITCETFVTDQGFARSD